MNDITSKSEPGSEAFVGKLKSGLALALNSAPESDNAKPLALLVALSGGADSTALLLGLKELSKQQVLRLVACHVNHGLRGKDADTDASFCQDLCKKIGVPITVKSINPDSLPHSTNAYSEELLRDRRYALLREAACAEGLKFIATAHVCEDQLETILFRLFRGSSLRGLTGMRQNRELEDGLFVIRPLLSVSKADCQQYVDAHGICARQDQTNDDTTYARNYLRHMVLPKILERFPSFPQQMESLRDIIREEEEFWHQLTSGSLEALSFASESDNVWSMSQFRALPLALKRRAVAESMRQRQIEVSFARVESVIKLVAQSPSEKHGGATRGALTLSPDWNIRISDNHIQWVKMRSPEAIYLDEVPVRVPGINMALACGKVLRIEDLKDVKNEEIGPFPDTSALDVIVDLSGAKPPLVLRSRRQGDVITPFGMKVPVSLKKYLHTHKPKDLAAESSKLGGIPLLADQEEVLWIPGVGISEKLRATSRPSHRLSWLNIAADPVEMV
jgi:tRNA(Ile)-lysidine synthase